MYKFFSLFLLYMWNNTCDKKHINNIIIKHIFEVQIVRMNIHIECSARKILNEIQKIDLNLQRAIEFTKRITIGLLNF